MHWCWWNKIKWLLTGFILLNFGAPENGKADSACAVLFKKSQNEMGFVNQLLMQTMDPVAERALLLVDRALELKNQGASSKEKVASFQDLAQAILLIKEKFETSRDERVAVPYSNPRILALLNHRNLTLYLVNSFLFIEEAKEATSGIIHSLLSIGHYYYGAVPNESFLYKYIRERSLEMGERAIDQNPLQLLFNPLVFMDGNYIENSILSRGSAISQFEFVLDYLNELVYTGLMDSRQARRIANKVVFKFNPLPLSRKEKEIVLNSLDASRGEKNIHAVLQLLGFVEVNQKEMTWNQKQNNHSSYWIYIYSLAINPRVQVTVSENFRVLKKGQFAGPQENKVYGYEALREKILNDKGQDKISIQINLVHEPE